LSLIKNGPPWYNTEDNEARQRRRKVERERERERKREKTTAIKAAATEAGFSLASSELLNLRGEQFPPRERSRDSSSRTRRLSCEKHKFWITRSSSLGAVSQVAELGRRGEDGEE